VKEERAWRILVGCRLSVRYQGSEAKLSGTPLWSEAVSHASPSGYPVEGTWLRCPASPTPEGGRRMETPQTHSRVLQGVRRRDLLKAGLAAGGTLSVWLLPRSPALWGTEAGPPKRGGILRVRGV
jgi:hypothetical protein